MEYIIIKSIPVKGFIRTKKGKLERVKPYHRTGIDRPIAKDQWKPRKDAVPSKSGFGWKYDRQKLDNWDRSAVLKQKFPGYAGIIDHQWYSIGTAIEAQTDVVNSFEKNIPLLVKAGVSKDELRAVDIWTRGSYRDVNAQLRGEKLEKLSSLEAKNVAENLNSFLSKAPKFKGKVLRRIRFTSKKNSYDFLANIKEGSIFKDKGFVAGFSGGFDLADFNAPDIHVWIIATGKNGSKIDYLSRNSHELEVLFRIGTKFRVTKIDLEKRVLYLEEK